MSDPLRLFRIRSGVGCVGDGISDGVAWAESCHGIFQERGLRATPSLPDQQATRGNTARSYPPQRLWRSAREAMGRICAAAELSHRDDRSTWLQSDRAYCDGDAPRQGTPPLQVAQNICCVYRHRPNSRLDRFWPKLPQLCACALRLRRLPADPPGAARPPTRHAPRAMRLSAARAQLAARSAARPARPPAARTSNNPSARPPARPPRPAACRAPAPARSPARRATPACPRATQEMDLSDHLAATDRRPPAPTTPTHPRTPLLLRTTTTATYCPPTTDRGSPEIRLPATPRPQKTR